MLLLPHLPASRKEPRTFPSPPTSLLLPTSTLEGTYCERSVGPMPLLTQPCHLSQLLFMFPAHTTVTCPCASLLPPSLPRKPLPPGHCYRASKPQLRSRLRLGALGSPTLSGAFPWIPTVGLHQNSVSHLPPSRLCTALSFPRGQWLTCNPCTIIVC